MGKDHSSENEEVTHGIAAPDVAPPSIPDGPDSDGLWSEDWVLANEDWLFHSKKLDSRWCWCGMRLGRLLMDRMTVDQRNSNPDHVRMLALDINNNNFVPVADGAAVNVNGEVFNFKNRINALFMACGESKRDIRIPMLISVGHPINSAMATDNNWKRNPKDQLKMSGVSLGSAVIDSKIRVIKASMVSGRFLFTRKNDKFSASALKDFTTQYQEDVAWLASKLEAHGSFLVKPYLVAALLFAYRTDPTKIDEFVTLLCDAEALLTMPKDSPVRQCVEFTRGENGYKNKRYDKMNALSKCLRCMHAFIRGDKLKTLQANEDAVKYFKKTHPGNSILRGHTPPVLVEQDEVLDEQDE